MRLELACFAQQDISMRGICYCWEGSFLSGARQNTGYGAEANRSRTDGTFLASPGHG